MKIDLGDNICALISKQGQGIFMFEEENSCLRRKMIYDPSDVQPAVDTVTRSPSIN
jgi:hypothetical protein